MDFALTPDQELLRETARGLLARECPPAVVRAHRDDPTAAEPLWSHLREFAALGTAPTVDLCVFVEEPGTGFRCFENLATGERRQTTVSLLRNDDGTMLVLKKETREWFEQEQVITYE